LDQKSWSNNKAWKLIVLRPDDAKKYHFGTILNGGGGFPNQNKNSTVEDWKNLSKS
jgi:hypothetical protein